MNRSHVRSPQICTEERWKMFRERITSDPEELRMLTDAAESRLGGPGYSVTFLKTPFERDPHDYVSLSKYAWPNPDTPDGLPWIQGDGAVNPETEHFDTGMTEMIHSVGILTAAARITGESRYAERAGFLLRQWFLNPETRMNPHLDCAQFLPGAPEGSSWGLIDAHFFCRLNEAVRALPLNKNWTEADWDSYRKWFLDFYFWLVGNPLPVKEEGSTSNHGTYYDVLLVSTLLLLDRPLCARRQLKEKTIPRLSVQLLQDGRMPFELCRTRSLGYMQFNLSAWAWLCNYALPFGLELWEMPSDDNGTLKKAFHLAFPHLCGKPGWPYMEIGQTTTVETLRLAQLVAFFADEPEAVEALKKMQKQGIAVYQTIPCCW